MRFLQGCDARKTIHERKKKGSGIRKSTASIVKIYTKIHKPGVNGHCKFDMPTILDLWLESFATFLTGAR